MPRPIYIICCQSGTDDKETGLLSHFYLYEKVTFQRVAQNEENPQALVLSQPMRAVAVWAKLPGDQPDQLYDFEMTFVLPPNGHRETVHKGTFSYLQDKTQYRIVVVAKSLPMFDGSGEFRVESRIRRAGTDDDWLTQDYPIIVEESPPTDANPALG